MVGGGPKGLAVVRGFRYGRQSAMVERRREREPSAGRELAPPRLREPVDLDAHLERLPRDASCKGMFFKTIFALGAAAGSPAELAKAAGIPARRYTPFLDYPMRDNLRLTVEVARRVYPRLALGEALAEIGSGIRVALPWSSLTSPCWFRIAR